MGHDFASERDVADLLDAAGVHEESDVGFTAANLAEGFVGVAHVGKVALLANGFFGEFQDSFQKAFVELHNVELLLLRR